MSVAPPLLLPKTENPHVAVTIARGERRRAKLERLSDIGMDLAEQVGAHAAAAMAAVNEDRAGDPGRPFATLSRSVRMTLALEDRFDDHILALRLGQLPAPRGFRTAAGDKPAKPESEQESEPARPVAKLSDPRRDRADKAVREAIYLDVETITEARERLDALNERLFDSEAYDALLDLPLRDAVAAICADLGLEPDWDLRSDEAGFVAPAGRRRVDWSTLVAQSPRSQTVRSAKPPPLRRRE